MTLTVLIVLSIALFAVDFRQTRGNMSAPWNGFGAIASVLKGEAQQPMQYRVLIPWLVWNNSARRYLWVKFIGGGFALTASYLYFSTVSAHPLLLTAILVSYFMWAALYDYADSYYEVGFFAISFWLMGISVPHQWLYLMFITVIAALNRETAIFIPVVALVSGKFWLASFLLASFTLGFMVPRLYYGAKDRYCPFNMIKENIERIKRENWGVNVFLSGYAHFFIISVLVVLSLFGGGIGAVQYSMAGLFLVLLIPSIWSEIRVFSPVMLGVLPVLCH